MCSVVGAPVVAPPREVRLWWRRPVHERRTPRRSPGSRARPVRRSTVLLALVLLAAVGVSAVALQQGTAESSEMVVRLWAAMVALGVVGGLTMRRDPPAH